MSHEFTLMKDAYEAIEPIARFGTLPTLTYLGMMAGQAAVRGVQEGTTFRDQLTDRTNQRRALLTTGAAAGLNYLTGTPYVEGGNLETGLELVGAGGIGAAVGTGIKSLQTAMNTSTNVAAAVRDKAREGAVKGAVAFPVAYLAVQELAKRF